MDTIPNINVASYTPRSSASETPDKQKPPSQSSGNMVPPMPPHGSSDMASPYNLTAVSTQQTDMSGTAQSPFFDDYTLGQPLSQFPLPAGYTSSISPPARPSEKLPELASIPISHSISYQPMAYEPNPAPRSAQPKPRAPRNKSKFKRFRNAFIYYVNDQRDKVDEETKKLKNREFLQLMSARWKSLPEEERRPYVKLAEEDKKRFNEDQEKFGKYESRQRRYNKVRTTAKHGTAPYALPGTQVPGMLATHPGLLYGGYGNVASAYANANAAALSPLYLNLQKASPASMAAAMANMQANPQYAALAGPAVHQAFSQQQPQQQHPQQPQQQHPQQPQQQHPQQQQSSLLAPPPLGQRNSGSSNASSSDLNNLRLSLSPSLSYNWNMPGAANNALSAQLAMQGRFPAAAAAYQQHTSPGNMQMPTGVPITHSLTEPVLYDNDSLDLALSGNWPQQP